mmetsp:Transcript_28232/g.65379  ORF Transcript_28232/g.65379 Transcript_28232/m.65379 type:complete len:105 (+) Transcript_28232:36-350(+)
MNDDPAVGHVLPQLSSPIGGADGNNSSSSSSDSPFKHRIYSWQIYTATAGCVGEDEKATYLVTADAEDMTQNFQERKRDGVACLCLCLPLAHISVLHTNDANRW